MKIIIEPKPDKNKMITIHKKKKELTDMTIRELFTYVHELENENARLEELYQKSIGVIAATDCAECKDKAVKHGHWIDGLGEERHCSVCHNYTFSQRPPYCEHCGAKMDGGADDEL